MQNAGIELPSGAGSELVGLRVKQDAVVALVPALEALAYFVFRCARIESEKGVREAVLRQIVLSRKIVSFGLPVLTHRSRIGFGLVHVVRNRPEVVEKLAQHVPAVLRAHDVGAQKFIAQRFDGLLQQDALAVDGDVTQALVLPRAFAVPGLGGGGKPALVDTAAVSAERVEVAWVKLQAAARHKKRARHPCGSKQYDTFARRQGVAQQGR